MESLAVLKVRIVKSSILPYESILSEMDFARILGVLIPIQMVNSGKTNAEDSKITTSSNILMMVNLLMKVIGNQIVLN